MLTDLVPVKYNVYYLPKPNGKRRKISEPDPVGKFSLQRLNQEFNNDWFKKGNWDRVMAFQPGKSTVDHARLHVGKDIVLAIDLRNYFDAITLNVFDQHDLWPEQYVDYIKENCFHQRALPQGAPTSPMLANLVTANVILPALEAHLTTTGIDYTMSSYADDIAISGPKELMEHYLTLVHILETIGFRVNKSKSHWIHNSGQQQKICGIVCNEKLNVDKKYVKQTRGLIHKIFKMQQDQQDAELEESILRGMLSYIHMITPEKFHQLKKYQEKFLRLTAYGQ